MQLTLRGLCLLLIGAVLIALLPLGAMWGIIALAWWLLAAALLLADWRLAPRRADWSLARHHDQRLSLATRNRIAVTVWLRPGATPVLGQNRRVRTWLRDDFPSEFLLVTSEQGEPDRAGGAGEKGMSSAAEDANEQMTGAGYVLSASLAPNVAHTIAYYLWPPRRGDYHFGDPYLRWLSPLGLWHKQARFDAGETIKVYPNLIDIKKYDLMLRRNRLADIGLRRTRLTGGGSEFERLRDYVPDDEYRRIDWKATARRAKPIAVEYEVERSQNIIALVDVGRMMRSAVAINSLVGDAATGPMTTKRIPASHTEATSLGSNPRPSAASPTASPTASSTALSAETALNSLASAAPYAAKLDYVINAVLLLAYVATQKGDKIGLLTFADSAQTWVAPRGGKRQFQRLLETLYAVEAQRVEPDYHEALGYFAAKQSKRSLAIVFTDFSGGSSTDALVAQMSRLQRQHLTLLVTIGDPTLYAAAQQPVVDGLTLHRRTVAERLLAERRATLESLRRRGIFTLDVSASDLSISLIDRYLQLKVRLAG